MRATFAVAFQAQIPTVVGLRDHAFGMPQRYDRFFKKTF
jgi:hypothetical protein